MGSQHHLGPLHRRRHQRPAHHLRSDERHQRLLGERHLSLPYSGISTPKRIHTRQPTASTTTGKTPPWRCTTRGHPPPASRSPTRPPPAPTTSGKPTPPWPCTSRSHRRPTHRLRTHQGTNDYWEDTTLAIYNPPPAGGKQITFEATTGANDFWEASTTQRCTTLQLPAAGESRTRRTTAPTTTGRTSPSRPTTASRANANRVRGDQRSQRPLGERQPGGIAGTSTPKRMQYEATNGANDYWENITSPRTPAFPRQSANNTRQSTASTTTGRTSPSRRTTAPPHRSASRTSRPTTSTTMGM